MAESRPLLVAGATAGCGVTTGVAVGLDCVCATGAGFTTGAACCTTGTGVGVAGTGAGVALAAAPATAVATDLATGVVSITGVVNLLLSGVKVGTLPETN